MRAWPLSLRRGRPLSASAAPGTTRDSAGSPSGRSRRDGSRGASRLAGPRCPPRVRAGDSGDRSPDARCATRLAPCGVPSSVADHFPFSRTPAASHFWMSRTILSSAMRCSTNFTIQPWSMASKNPPSSLEPTPTAGGRGARFAPGVAETAPPIRRRSAASTPDPIEKARESGGGSPGRGLHGARACAPTSRRRTRRTRCCIASCASTSRPSSRDDERLARRCPASW